MHFAVLPDQRAAGDPHAPALADQHNGRLTNAEFLRRVQVAASRLSQAGVSAGDVVAVKLPNRVEFVVALFAAWRLGAAATPVNPFLTRAEVSYQLADSGACVVVCEDDSGGAVATVTLAQLSAGQAAAAGRDFPGDDLALLVYTSGTTGRPKGVELTYGNLMAMARSMIAAMGPAAEDSHSLLVLPLFHVNGIVVSVLTPLLAGGQATVAGRFDPATFFGIVESVRPTYFSAVPTMYAMLAALPSDVTPDTSSLRYAVCGAAPDADAIDRAVRGAIRHTDRRGLRVVGGHLRNHLESGRWGAQTGHRRGCPSRPAGGDHERARRVRLDGDSRRGGRQGSDGDARLPQPAAGHRENDRRRLVAHRRHRVPRRGRLPDAG